jgi:hypothetical protein
MSSEEILIRGLYELSCGEKQTSIAARFGRHSSDQGRAYTYFVNFMYDTYRKLVNNNLEWWHAMGYFKYSHELIKKKCHMPEDRPFALFIDCNCFNTAMPGGGPTDEGANSRR